MGRTESIHQECLVQMKKTYEIMIRDFSQIRLGRAQPQMLDGIRVEVYGTMTPLPQVSSVSVVDSKTVSVVVWDTSNVEAVDGAIRKSELSLNPRIEGNKLFITIPELTEETRQNIVKMVKKKSEDTKIQIRNTRRDINETFKKMEKDKSISEDDLKISLEKVQKTTDEFIEKVDQSLSQKNKELITL